MNKTYFILLTTGMYFSIVECALAPDINLEGRLLTNNDIKILQLICTTDIPVQLCTVEFLKDKKTHDDIKYVNSNCYHTNGKCSSTICACSDDCMSFTLNVTVPEDINNHLIYSCVSRMEKEGVTYLATISGIHDSNGGFKLYKKTVVSYGSLSSTQKTTTFSQDISTVSSISVPLVIVVAASVVTTCAMLFIISLIICRRYCKSTPEQNRNSSTEVDLGSLAGFPHPMTRYNSPRKWKPPSPTLEWSKRQDTVKHVKYLREKEKRPTISTISTNSGSVQSLDDIIFLPANISTWNDSSDA